MPKTLYSIAPLEFRGDWPNVFCADGPNGERYVIVGIGGKWGFMLPRASKEKPCVDYADGKRLCQQHHEESLRKWLVQEEESET